MKTIEKIYTQRAKFSVIALTGVTGSGCTELATLMNSPFETLKGQIRGEIENEKEQNKDFQIFKRKYNRAFRLLKKEYKKYNIISYKNVVILETLILLLKEKDKTPNKTFLEILQKHFEPSANFPGHEGVNLDLDVQQLDRWGLDYIIQKIQEHLGELDEWNLKKGYWREFITEIFFSEEFKNFCKSLFDYLKAKDYFLKNLLVHRLSNAIRSFGNPKIRVNYTDKNSPYYYENADMEYLFYIIGLINDIIKGATHNTDRNFVIDSLRCSLEIVFLRERYNAFYMVAMHNENCKENIKNKVEKFEKGNQISLITNDIFRLGLEEISPKHYEDGVFSVPDIYNCVASSEIHIFKRDNQRKDVLDFYTTAEQLMKILALMLHPGLFTPSNDERCMSIAYQIKFNSGCISRQVGCVITDDNYIVKSIGWNDVPEGQIPCGLTSVDEFLSINPNTDDKDHQYYSKFEYEGIVKRKDENKKFKVHMQESYDSLQLKKIEDLGLYVPFCFKSCYNAFKGDKDNVNTRSLHAEENTMLQVSKNGGIGLNGGKMYVTASPCVLCSKKAYQIGIKEIIYLDEYTDIAEDQIIDAGFNKPEVRGFCGIIGPTYYKLYQPFMSYKDELNIRLQSK